MKQTIADRISDLPEELIIHILSFLTIKECIATSVLSKKWKSIRRPDHTFHLKDYTLSKETYQPFVQSVNKFITSRDVNQPLQRFHFKYSPLLHEDHVNEWIGAAAQRKVEYLDIFGSIYSDVVLYPTNPILSCQTILELHLHRVQFLGLSSVYMPSLKTMHLCYAYFLERKHLAEFLSGTPNLERLKLKKLRFERSVIEAKFKRCSKLVRATVTGDTKVPLEVFNNVQILQINSMEKLYHRYLIPEFSNLTEIIFDYKKTIKDWPGVFKVVKHCPKLRHLSIYKMSGDKDDGKADWPYPQDVPLCISLELKICYLRTYGGSESEFRFARYILENARHLRTLKIYSHASDEQEKLKMLQNLTLCSRLSTTCKVSFQ